MLNYVERQKLAQIAAKLKYGVDATRHTALVTENLLANFPSIEKDYEDYAEFEATQLIIKCVINYLTQRHDLKMRLTAVSGSYCDALTDWCHKVGRKPTSFVDRFTEPSSILYGHGFAQFLLDHPTDYEDMDVIIGVLMELQWRIDNAV